MLIDFCRSSECAIRKVIDAPEVVGYITEARKKEIIEGSACKNCAAWKYERYMEEQHDERCVDRA